MNKKCIYFLAGLAFTLNVAFAQKADEQPAVLKKYVVFFKDKANSPFSLSAPEKFLSERALERRRKSGIRVDETDIPVNGSYIKQVTDLGYTYINKSNWSNCIMVSSENEKLLKKLHKLQPVAEVKEVYSAASVKKDPMAALIQKMESSAKSGQQGSNIQNAKTFDYGKSIDQVGMLGVDYMHSKGYTGEGLIIAVLDGGFFRVNELPAFQSLRENHQILRTWDFVANEESVYEDNSHGMSVLSCIAGYIPGKLIGTGPKANFYLLRTEDAGSETLAEEYNWEAAAVWADSAGADIINSSLGYTKFDNDIGSHTYMDMNGNTTVVTRAADMAARKGIFVVNSAGNEGSSPWRYIGAPADGDSVLAIGAVKANREIATFSSRGPSYDGRVKPNVCAMGQGTLVSLSSGEIGPSNGTSFSGPVIAGAVATLWQANPQASNMQLYDAIQRSADRYSTPGGDYGYGIPNFGYADMLLKNMNGEDAYNDQKIIVYPNPNDGSQLFFDFFAAKESEIIIEVSDLQGRVIQSQARKVLGNTMNFISVNLFSNNMAQGTYILTVRDGNTRFTSKFLKQ